MVSKLNMAAQGYLQGVSTPGVPSSSAAPDARQVAPAVGGPEKRATEGQETVKINASAKPLANLEEAKNASALTAQSARDANQGLDQAESLLNDMASLVGAVKNYPPFPAGNEDRVQYLNSIDGLRKQLQSLEIPPVADFEPVIYPREDVFPPLDAKVPSDAAVLAFGEAVQAVKVNLDAARQALEAQVQKLADRSSAGLPRPPEEPQAREVSVAVAGQLQGRALPIAGSTEVFSQL